MENNGSLNESLYLFTPVDFPEANSELNGRALDDKEQSYSTQDVKSIRCFKENDSIVITKWKLKSIKARIKFLLTGEINMIVLGPTQPPTALRIDSPFLNTQNNQK